MSSSVEQAWEMLEKALALHEPRHLKALKPPGAPEQVAQFEKTVGFKLSADVSAFFLRHDGEEEVPELDPLFRGARLVPLLNDGHCALSMWRFNEDCAKRSKRKRAEDYVGPVRQVIRHPKWIPFATDWSGNGLYFDLDPDEGGKVGQVIRCSYDAASIHVVAESPGAFLVQQADRVLAKTVPLGGDLSESSVLRAWKKFEEALQKHAPKSVHALQPPASQADLDVLREELGFEIPKDIRDFFAGHNGEEPIDDMAAPLFVFGYLIPIDSRRRGQECVLGEYGTILDMVGEGLDDDIEYEGPVRKKAYTAKRIPFAIDYSGNSLCFDLDPAAGGTIGQVLECDYDSNTIKVIAESVADFLEARADEILEGSPVTFDDEEAPKPPQKPVIDERELLEFVVRVDNPRARLANPVLSTPSLRSMDLELRLLDPQVLIDAKERFNRDVMKNFGDRTEVKPECTVVFTVYRPSAPEKSLNEGSDDFMVDALLFLGETQISSGSGRLYGIVPGLGPKHPIFYTSADNSLPDHATFYVTVKGRKA